MTCACHDEPMFWHASRRHSSGGHWRCAVTKRESDLAWVERNREQRRLKQLDAYHAAGGGYVKRRLRMLGAQRAQAIEQLAELTREKGTLSD